MAKLTPEAQALALLNKALALLPHHPAARLIEAAKQALLVPPGVRQ